MQLSLGTVGWLPDGTDCPTVTARILLGKIIIVVLGLL